MKWNDLIGANKIGNIIDAIIHKKVEINKYLLAVDSINGILAVLTKCTIKV